MEMQVMEQRLQNFIEDADVSDEIRETLEKERWDDARSMIRREGMVRAETLRHEAGKSYSFDFLLKTPHGTESRLYYLQRLFLALPKT